MSATENSFWGAERTLAAATPTYLKPFLPVEPAELLVVHDDAFAPEQDVKPSIAKPPTEGGQFAQTSPDNPVVRPDAAIAHRRPVHSQG
jgi:hypothetical protein